MGEQLDYNIKLLEKLEDGCRYEINVTIPMSYGWLEDMYYCVSSDKFNYCFIIPEPFSDLFAPFYSKILKDSFIIFPKNF